MYYIKKMPDGLPRASHKKKTVGSPQLHKRIQQEARKTVILEKNKMISFRYLSKSHNFGAKETHEDFLETKYLQNVLY